MNYIKHSQKQKRKQLIMQKKMENMRMSSAYSCGKQSSTGMTLMGIIVLIGYITNAAEINAIASSLM